MVGEENPKIIFGGLKEGGGTDVYIGGGGGVNGGIGEVKTY